MWITLLFKFWREILIITLAGIISAGFLYVKALRADVKRLEWANTQYEQTIKDIQEARDKMYQSYDSRITGKNLTIDKIMKICSTTPTTKPEGGSSEIKPSGDGILDMLNSVIAQRMPKPNN